MLCTWIPREERSSSQLATPYTSIAGGTPEHSTTSSVASRRAPVKEENSDASNSHYCTLYCFQLISTQHTIGLNDANVAVTVNKGLGMNSGLCNTDIDVSITPAQSHPLCFAITDSKSSKV